MFATPYRTKGAGPQLGARQAGDIGPFGRRGLEDAELGEDDDQGAQDDDGAQDLDQTEPRLHMAQDP